MGIPTFLIIVAIILWALEALSWPNTGQVHLGWLGMVAFGLSFVIK